jgi:hypothetical protein
MKKLIYLFLIILIAACSDYNNEPCPSRPKLQTNPVTEINFIVAEYLFEATLNGNISNIPLGVNCEINSITSQGFVYSTKIQPTIADNIIQVNGKEVSTVVNQLSSETIYYVRTFITNQLGTFYGNEISFETPEGVQIGDIIEGGVVFWLDPENTSNGLVVAFEDVQGPETQGTSKWGCYGTNVAGSQGSAIGTGLQNTIDIIASNGTGNCSINIGAAQICSSLDIDGYDDWFLPSIDELNEIYNNLDVLYTIEGFKPFVGSYWSSTEESSFRAWRSSFNNRKSFISKDTRSYVRAIRYFN